jgi:hypothetical protein
MKGDLSQLFERLKGMLKEYEGPFESKHNDEKRFDLWSFKPVEILGRKRKEVFFAELIIRKDYVGFYYMPIYTNTELKDVFKPELLSLLKGKSCFHVRTLEGGLEEQIREALKIGFDLYQKRNWV